MSTLIHAKGLTKTYNADTDVALTVLKAIDVRIDEGDFVAIMGPSGSGKSTLMHLLGFLDTPSAGQYVFEGEQTEDFDEDQLANIRNKKIGFVFQAFHLLPRTSAMENVQLPLVYAGVGRTEQYDRAKSALEQVGLGDRLDHLPNELSGGQQQRVSIARALVTEPRVIFADEPTGNLDSKASHDIMGLLTELNNEGKTIIMVTHEDDIAEHAKRIIRLRDGNIESDKRKK